MSIYYQVAEVLFWVSGFMVLYPYFIYPVVLYVAALFHKQSESSDTLKPAKKVTLIISAYNEEGAIEEKLINSLRLDYPKELLEIMVVSDGSTDSTDGIVRSFAAKGVVLKRFDRIGKSACLNLAVPQAKGDIIVFTDANSMLDQSSIKFLASHFADPSVGFVTGGTRYVSEEGGEGAGFYNRIEQLIKGLESRISSCVGADGALFAIRKGLYTPLSDTDINDLVIPFNIIRQGYRGLYDRRAFTTERTAGSHSAEFNRQVRITARTIRALFKHSYLLNPFRFGLFSFMVFSHKVLRLVSPLLMICAFVSNALLVVPSHFYSAVFAVQALFYLLAGAGSIAPSAPWRVFSIPFSFLSYNLAVVKGWLNYFKGNTFVTWQPVR